MIKGVRMLKSIDIGANLTDYVYRGRYHSNNVHQPDIQDVLARSHAYGVERIFVTGGNLKESIEAIELCKQHPFLYCTVGCHPTRCKAFEESGDPEKYYNSLLDLISKNREYVVAVGECGLDYARLHFCDKSTQLTYFERQFSLARSTGLPMFLHSRDAEADFVRLVQENMDSIPKAGVVHSFTGTMKEMEDLVSLGFHIGINGCSLKTEDNLKVAAAVPLEKLHVETDAPYCEIRPTHASFQYVQTKFPSVKKHNWQPGKLIKSRNEPCTVVQVLEVLSAIKNTPLEELATTIYSNTMKLFFDK